MMVNLDGGKDGGCLPSQRILSSIPTTCWTVQSRDGKIKSFNFDDTKNFCPSESLSVYGGWMRHPDVLAFQNYQFERRGHYAQNQI
jgi:hypothetical protein